MSDFGTRAYFLDAPMDLLSMRQTVGLAVDAMLRRTKISHVALNVSKLVKMRADRQLWDDVTGADIVGIDGMGIIWGARLLGVPATERVSGIDLMHQVLAECARKGFRPYFLGATQEVVDAAADAARKAYPGLEFAGLHHGYFRVDDAQPIIADINASKADCLFIGMPTPYKERFLAKYRQQIDAAFVMGVGGSFDVLSGKTARAPGWMQRSGLEWLFRTLQEPRRLIWRYAETNVRFLALLLQELLRAGARGALGRRAG